MYEIYLTGMLLPLAILASALSLTRGKGNPRLKWGYRLSSLAFLSLCGVLPLTKLAKINKRTQAPIIAEDLGDHRLEGNIIMQTSGSSCSAATMANIGNCYGANFTEKQLARAFKTTRYGTNDSNVIRAMQTLGFSCKVVKLDVKDLQHTELPVALFVYHPATGPETHAVACFGCTEAGIEIWDPLVGKVYFSEDKLNSVWQGTAMTCYPLNPID